MTLRFCGCRIRSSYRLCDDSGLWWDRTKFTEGNVYRFKIGVLFVKFLVDWMSERERTLREQAARGALQEWL